MMVVSRIGQELRFTYTLVDQVLDFLLSIQLKPLIQLSFMPKELAENQIKRYAIVLLLPVRLLI